jgi:hypothetical protein
MIASQVSAVATIFLPIRPAKSTAYSQSSTINPSSIIAQFVAARQAVRDRQRRCRPGRWGRADP